jgi:putative molybdopterin biosynthesis protein
LGHDNVRMKARGVHLQYRFETTAQAGAAVHNPLFDLLQAVQEHGSIQRAATALGQSYRHVWGQLREWQDTIGEPLVHWTQGQPARLTAFAERLLWAETQARVRLTPHIEALRAELSRVLTDALDGQQQVLTMVASHDLALPALRDTASRAEQLHIDLRFAGSIDALRALAEGRCTVAGFHVPPLQDGAALFSASLKPLLKPGTHKLIGCSRRTQGLMVAAGNPLNIRSLADLAALRARFVWRQAGSATRLLTQHLLAQAKLQEHQLRDAGLEDSHNAVAAAVASGQADAGIGLEAAAHAFGLGFVPLAQDDYFLVCLAHALEEPAVQALRRTLEHKQWQQAVAALPGYALMEPGRVLSLTTALPWWHFRKPKGTKTTPAP